MLLVGAGAFGELPFETQRLCHDASSFPEYGRNGSAQEVRVGAGGAC